MRQRVHCSLVLDQQIINSFRQKGALHKFISPLKISSPGFETDTTLLTKESEFQLFEAFHFLDYWEYHAAEERKTKLIRLKRLVRNRIVCANLGLVFQCLHITSIHAEPDELLGDGQLALIDAVEKFNPYKGYRFSTYATTIILRRFSRRIKKKQLPIDECDPLDCVDSNLSVDKETEQKELLKKLESALRIDSGILTQEDIDILNARFNLKQKHHKRYTLREVAVRQKRSKEGIRQIQKAALIKLRNIF